MSRKTMMMSRRSLAFLTFWGLESILFFTSGAISSAIAQPFPAPSCQGTQGALRGHPSQSSERCQPTVSAAPSTCYWRLLSYGLTSSADRSRAAYLCAHAIDRSPATCYWQGVSLGIGGSRDRDYWASVCRSRRYPRYYP